VSGALRVFLDANVFVTTWTLDVLLTLADRGLLEPRWSDQVLEEARVAVDRVHVTKGGARYIAAAMRAFPFAMVEADEGNTAGTVLPDPDDQKVVAGAIAGACDVIVTYNVKHFPADVLSEVGLRVLRPDDLLMRVAAIDPEGAVEAVRSIVAAKKHPPRTMEEELEGLRVNKLGKFADFIAENVGQS
jgi:predicted nucleic acid-binding protein